MTIHDSYPAAILNERAQSAIDLKAIGQHKDIEYCLHKNGSSCVPFVTGVEETTGLLQLACLTPATLEPSHS
jgi:phosphosulfolactate phosphohydrolase-like enzyme